MGAGSKLAPEREHTASRFPWQLILGCHLLSFSGSRSYGTHTAGANCRLEIGLWGQETSHCSQGGLGLKNLTF